MKENAENQARRGRGAWGGDRAMSITCVDVLSSERQMHKQKKRPSPSTPPTPGPSYHPHLYLPLDVQPLH